jgi:hypothetical protein
MATLGAGHGGSAATLGGDMSTLGSGLGALLVGVRMLSMAPSNIWASC